MKREFLTLMLLHLGLSACISLERHPQSGYHGGNFYNPTPAAQTYFDDQKSYEVYRTKRELGIATTRSLNEHETKVLNQRMRLRRLENTLLSSIEKKQYYTYKPFLKNDADRIYFLRINSMEARERWVRSQGIKGEDDGSRRPAHIKELIEDSDITTGMSKKAVVESWGDPDIVEVAGNPMYGNERWKYHRTIASESGFNSETHVVYFESGRVIGWEKKH